MSWPSLESFIPESLRGGPIPDDVAARALDQMRDAWQRYAAQRVHGAEARALAFLAFSRGGAPYAYVFDGRFAEAASLATEASVRAMTVLAGGGIFVRQAGVALWRESLSSDQAAARWRALGGDEAFALGPAQSGGHRPVQAYVLVRRGHDRVRLELSALDLPANDALRAWAQRLKPYLRGDVSAALLGP